MGLQCHDVSLERAGSRGAPLTILDRIEVQFESGGLSLITGPPGSGKSSLLHVLAGLLRPTSGEVLADDQPVSRWKADHRERWRRRVGIVFQHLHLMAERSAIENVLAPLLPFTEAGEMHGRARAALERMDIASLAAVPVRMLSGGQRQLVALARALVVVPRFFLLDEPTTFQDDPTVERLVRIWRQAADDGACGVVCSHDPRLRSHAAFDSGYRLAAGRLEAGR